MTQFWWLSKLGPRPPRKPAYILRRVDNYLREHRPPKPIRSPVPFSAGHRGGEVTFYYLVAGDGLRVVVYDHRGRQIGELEPYVTWVSKIKCDPTRVALNHRALENFHELLAPYVFPAV